MTPNNYWKAIPQFVLCLNGLYAELRIGAVQAEWALWKFVWEKKIKMRVTSVYIECTTTKCYHSIELAEAFF